LTGTVASAPIYVLNVDPVGPNTGTLIDGDRIRIGTGSLAEYRLVDRVGDPGDLTSPVLNHVPLNFSLSRTHEPAVTVDHIARTPIALPVATLSLSADVDRGAETILVTGHQDDIAVLVGDQLLEISLRDNAANQG
jgi:hypothetical protein